MNYEDVLSNLTVHHPLPSEVNEHNADEVQSLQESRVYGTSPMKGRRFKLRWMMTWLGLLELGMSLEEQVAEASYKKDLAR